MIYLGKNRDLIKLSKEFYALIKNDIESALSDNINDLNKYKTKSNKKLGDYLKKHIESIITKPLDKLIKEYEDELKKVFEDNYSNISNTKTFNQFKKAINDIFFFEKYEKWNPYDFTKKLDIHCCPYCNRTYITILGDDKNKFSRPDIDHFLPKFKYPYLRLSFYNLIPSCVICNRNAKGKKHTSLENNIHPYLSGFKNVKFKQSPKNRKDIIGMGNAKIEFDYSQETDSNHIIKCKANIKLFRLEQQYSTQIIELNHLLNIKHKHTNAYIKDLLTKYPTLLKDKKDAYKLAFGKEFESNNDDKAPLSKFTRDMLEKIKMLEDFDL